VSGQTLRPGVPAHLDDDKAKRLLKTSVASESEPAKRVLPSRPLLLRPVQAEKPQPPVEEQLVVRDEPPLVESVEEAPVRRRRRKKAVDK